MRYVKKYTNTSNMAAKDNLLRVSTKASTFGKLVFPSPEVFRKQNFIPAVDENGHILDEHLPDEVVTTDAEGKISMSKLPNTVVVLNSEGKLEVNGTTLPLESLEFKTTVEGNKLGRTNLYLAANDIDYLEFKDPNNAYAIEILLTAIHKNGTQMANLKCSFSVMTDANANLSASDAIFEVVSNIGDISFIGISLPEVSLIDNKIYITVLPTADSVWYTTIKTTKVNY